MGGVKISVSRLDEPVVQGLIEQLQAEYVVRYGGPDDAPIDAAEFAPPKGLFLLATDDSGPVGMGGWRVIGGREAEIKRMFVVTPARGSGYARALLAELERTAAAAGIDRLVLETGLEQPEAMALYASSGYDLIAGFGYYAGYLKSRAYGKWLAP